MKIFLIVLALIISNSQLFAQKTGAFSITFNNNGIQSKMAMYVPENYDSTKAYPMLWGWHGGGMSCEEMLQMISIINSKVELIIVCPDINNIEHQEQFSYLMNFSYHYPKINYHIDTNNIIICGYSMGGSYAYNIGLSVPDKVSGIIGFAPMFSVGNMEGDMWNNIYKVKMANILGKKDENYTEIKELMVEIQNKYADLLLIEKSELDHEGSNGYYNSQEFVDDFYACYSYVFNETISKVESNDDVQNHLVVYTSLNSDYIQMPGYEGNVIIFNSLGQEVWKNSILNNEQINISTLKEGVYIIKTQKEFIKFIKQ